MGSMLEHINFDRIDFEESTLYDLQEAVDGENDDLIWTVVERVIEGANYKAEIEAIVDDLPVPNGQTFAEARATQNTFVERILNAVFSITDEPF